MKKVHSNDDQFGASVIGNKTKWSQSLHTKANKTDMNTKTQQDVK